MLPCPDPVSAISRHHIQHKHQEWLLHSLLPIFPLYAGRLATNPLPPSIHIFPNLFHLNFLPHSSLLPFVWHLSQNVVPIFVSAFLMDVCCLFLWSKTFFANLSTFILKCVHAITFSSLLTSGSDICFCISISGHMLSAAWYKNWAWNDDKQLQCEQARS